MKYRVEPWFAGWVGFNLAWIIGTWWPGFFGWDR